MDIKALLPDEEQTVAVQNALINVVTQLREASYDYAEAALGSANETLKLVQAAEPCCSVWPHVVNYKKFSKKSAHTMQAAVQATGILLMSEETM